jgi:MFS family permease
MSTAMPVSMSSYGSQGLNVADYHSKLNAYVVVVSLIAASGGLLFGYDLGITGKLKFCIKQHLPHFPSCHAMPSCRPGTRQSHVPRSFLFSLYNHTSSYLYFHSLFLPTGGVEATPAFQQKFFPDVYEANLANEGNTDPWCVYNSATLQLFTSSLFLAGLVISLPAAYATRRFGRKFTMICAATCFIIGAALNAAAENLAMLIVGRTFLGFGIGGSNAVVPLYLSEMAPFKLRGALNNLFQLLTTLGILIAQLVNYALVSVDWGWRLSLGLAAVPAIVLLLGGIFLPESPNSLIERGYNDSGRAVLEKLRGTEEIQAEYDDIVLAAEESKKISAMQSFKAQFQPAYLPMFITTISIAFFQQFTGYV